MIQIVKSSLFTSLLILGASTGAQAEGLYGLGALGASIQNNDSAAYGDNLGVDPDFPAFDSGDGGVGIVGLGYDLGNQVRVEGRLGLHRSTFTDTQFGTGARAGEEYILDGEIKSRTLTVEAFYDIETGSSIKPYVKAGLGVARNAYSARLGGEGVAGFDAFDGVQDGYYDAYADEETTEMSWNIGVGASMAVSDTTTLFGEYQYVTFGDGNTGQDSFTDGFAVDAAAHEVMVGLRVSF